VINVNLGPHFPSGLLVVQDGANDPQVLAEDDGELENISTNFKFVPWQNVARAFPTPLMIDPVTFNPRGTVDRQIALLVDDVRRLVLDGALDAKDARKLLHALDKAGDFAARGKYRPAQEQIDQFIKSVAQLVRKREIRAAEAGSLIVYATSLRAYLCALGH